MCGLEAHMNVGESITHAIDDFEMGRTDSVVLHACAAVDGTAKKAYPAKAKRNRDRFTPILRDNYWLLEPMVVPGINLDETEFSNVATARGQPADFASVVYEVHRCNHAHGDELPCEFTLTPAVGSDVTVIQLADGVLHLPDRLPFGLIAVAVLDPTNRGQTVPPATSSL